MKWLKREWETSSKTIEILMTADKQNMQEWINQLEDESYDFLILDRYILCQMSYAVANDIDGQWVIQLQKYMRKPDIDFVIDIDPETSMNRKGKYGDNDRYESDIELLTRVREYYKYMSLNVSAPIKHIVYGLRSVENIHEEIYQIVKSEFGVRG